jgi:hypothetical protein
MPKGRVARWASALASVATNTQLRPRATPSQCATWHRPPWYAACRGLGVVIQLRADSESTIATLLFRRRARRMSQLAQTCLVRHVQSLASMTYCVKACSFFALACSFAGCSGVAAPQVGPGSSGASTQVANDSSGGTGTGGGTQVANDSSGGTGTGGTSAADTSLVGKCDDGSPLPVSASSVQTVTFTLRNASGGTRYIVTEGNQCTPFGIAWWTADSWQGLILKVGTPTSCNGECNLCECDWPTPAPSAVRALEPGDSYAFEWSATSYAVCSTPIAACPNKTMWVAAGQPVAPGRYRLSVPLADAVPTDCSPTSDTGKYTCSPGALSFCMWVQATCRLQSSASVEFTLPESGNIQVDVPLT